MKAILGLAVVCLGLGCGQQGAAPTSERGYGDSTYETPRAEERSIPSQPSVGTPIGGRQQSEATKARFLNSIRQADPQSRTIERALMNEQGELGLVLSRNVEMDDIPKLMKSMLTRMASDFPGQDLTIVAYAPADPPLKIGTARLDASSREMTYTPTTRR